MNKLETRYAMYLEGLRLAGEILRWDFEPFKLYLAARTSYKPDFVVATVGGLEIHETKGEYIYEDSTIKLKVVAEMYPNVRVKMVRRVRGEWVIRLVGGG